MLKADATVSNFLNPTLRRGQGGLVLEHLSDTVGRLGSHGGHHEDESQHHHLAQNLNTVGDQCG